MPSRACRRSARGAKDDSCQRGICTYPSPFVGPLLDLFSPIYDAATRAHVSRLAGGTHGAYRARSRSHFTRGTHTRSRSLSLRRCSYVVAAAGKTR